MSTYIEELEHMIDQQSLKKVLEALSFICYEKASHLEENWQDSPAGGRWTRAGGKISSLAASDYIEEVS
jgi:hypothetical protein